MTLRREVDLYWDAFQQTQALAPLCNSNFLQHFDCGVGHRCPTRRSEVIMSVSVTKGPGFAIVSVMSS